MQQMHKN